jgi:hypothetical protein
MIARYKDKVKYWEIWNEPDSRTYWVKQDRMATYTGLLKEYYIKAKEIDPSCKIVLGGLTENANIPLKHIYGNGGGQYFDVVNIHPFVNPLKEDKFQTLRSKINTVKRVMGENNDADKPIWLTELGAPGVKNPTTTNGWWHGISPSENEQADWLEEVYTRGVELPQVEKIFWAFFQDTDKHFNSGVDSFGLIRSDFSLKPGYHIYKRCIENWVRPELK